MNPLSVLVAQAVRTPGSPFELASFGFFATLALVGALATVVARNPIRSAVGLFVHVISLAGLYLTLSAHFLAVIQLLVYAGAIVVLFVFVIMLLGPSADTPRDGRLLPTRVIGVLGVAAVTSVIVGTLAYYRMPTPTRFPEFGTLRQIGHYLFTQAVIPFELLSVTLVVAMIGAFAIARGQHKKVGGTSASGAGATPDGTTAAGGSSGAGEPSAGEHA